MQKAFAAGLGKIPYPLLADFHPKGAVAKTYGIYNEDGGTARRAVFIIDRDGIVRFKRLYDRGLPSPEEILTELDKLG